MRRLEGRVALVTGAAGGVGRSVAAKLAAEGAHLVLNDLDEAPLQATASELAGGGAMVTTVAGSVTAGDFPDRFVDAALSGFGRVDILVNNAGYIWNARIEKTSDEQWNAMLDVHLGTPFRIIRRVVQHWKSLPVAADSSAHRKIVNVSSISGTHGAVGQAGDSADYISGQVLEIDGGFAI